MARLDLYDDPEAPPKVKFNVTAHFRDKFSTFD